MKFDRFCLQLVILLAVLAQVLTSQSAQLANPKHPREYTFKVVRTFPHDPNAFTQGLAYRDGFLYEGTGLKGRSSLGKVRLETGEVVQQVDLPGELFGEGIALLKNEVVQLTWQSQTEFVYSLKDFRLLRRFYYPGEGWGLATRSEE